MFEFKPLTNKPAPKSPSNSALLSSLKALSKSSKKKPKVLGSKDSASESESRTISDIGVTTPFRTSTKHGMLHSVRILADRFKPAYLRIKIGDSVEWRLEGGGNRRHVVTFTSEESDLMRTQE